MARYRLKYCLKGPLNPKQPTNQKPRATFLQLLNVDNFETFVNCSLNACGVNEDDELKHSSTAIKLGHDIERLAAAKGTYAIKNHKKEMKNREKKHQTSPSWSVQSGR